jgi:hypothetical protein
MDAYIRWLKESDQPLFEIGGTFWRSYQKGLVPASLKPEPIELNSELARYRRVHCDFKLMYRPAVGALVSLLYAVRTIADQLPGSAWSNRIQSVVRQEGLRRLRELNARARAPQFGTLF